MFLTDEEKQMLEGAQGPAVQKAMQILVALGESFGAKRMVPVNNVHMAGASIVVAGDAGTLFVEDTSKMGGKFVAETTTNPSAVDPSQWRELGFDEPDVALQGRLTGAYEKMGAIICNTCTPYLLGSAPRFGEHVAWGESSAVVYCNSVLGARTNREGGPSGLASSLTGRTPEYGFHLTENRYGKLLVNVTTELKDMTDFGSLGYHVGRIAGQDTPVFTGIPSDASVEELKELGAALASSGAVSMFHAVGVTPEAPTLEAAFGGRTPEKVLEFGAAELAAAEQALNKEPSDHVDWVVVGCPNASIREVRQVAETLAGKHINEGVTMWVVTNTPTYALAEKMGYVQTIKDAGVKIVRETCPVLAPSRALAKKNGYKTLTTNSAKMAHYAPGQFGLLTHYGRLERVIAAAVNGSWR